MRGWWLCVWLCVVVLVRTELTDAKVGAGIITTQGFQFLDKFCFSAECGCIPGRCNQLCSVSFMLNSLSTIKVGTFESPGTYVALYDDQDFSWPAVRALDTCAEKLSYTQALMNNGSSGVWIQEADTLIYLQKQMQRDNISVNDVECTCPPSASINPVVLEENLRPRWWYAVAINCERAIDLEWTLTFLNMGGSQLGFNNRGMITLHVFFFCFCMAWLAANFLMQGLVRFKTLCTCSLQLWFWPWWSFIIYTSGLTFEMLSWIVYQNDGLGWPGGGNWAMELSSLTVSAGFLWGSLKPWDAKATLFTTSGAFTGRQRLVCGSIATVAFLYVVLLVWQASVYMTAWDVDFFYESTLGALMMVVVWMMLGFFGLSMFQLYRGEQQASRRRVYKLFGFLGVFWFFTRPLFVFIGFGVASYYQAIVVKASLLTITTLVILGLLHLLDVDTLELFGGSLSSLSEALTQNEEDSTDALPTNVEPITSGPAASAPSDSGRRPHSDGLRNSLVGDSQL